MAKTTIVFGVLLIALGLAGYLYTGSAHSTALIPAWFGLALGVCGFLSISPSETRRKIFAHVNVTLGAAGFLLSAYAALHAYGMARSAGIDPDHLQIGAELVMAVLLLIYINLCVRSFIAARRAKN